MKINRRIIMAALVLGLVSAGSVIAQDSRIAASPKLQSQLSERQVVSNPSSSPMAHRCGDCTDSVVTVVDKATKGGKAITSQAVRHNCAACDTKFVAMGSGKATHDVAVHFCKSESKPLCCAKN